MNAELEQIHRRLQHLGLTEQDAEIKAALLLEKA